MAEIKKSDEKADVSVLEEYKFQCVVCQGEYTAADEVRKGYCRWCIDKGA